MNAIAGMVIVATVTYGFYKLFELFVRRKERIALVEKLGENWRPDMLKGDFNLSLSSISHTFTALKIGSLLVGMGLGMLVGYLICCVSIPNYWTDVDTNHYYHIQSMGNMIYGACVLVFGGLGLLGAFIVELKLMRKYK